jgi:2,4-dienoyl-CoA reductase-like NADH-dependent reductase (Old Yellow Enzyme family)
MSIIGSDFILNNDVVIKNRIVKAAMSEQLGTTGNDPIPGLAELYGRWARGGVGLCITGHIMVDRGAMSEPGNVVLDESSDKTSFSRWTKEGTANNTHMWAQLNHPGKQSPDFLCKQPVAPSAIKLEDGLALKFNKPRELTDSDIWVLVDKFATSARLAKEVGFTGVEIHGAHGYLISQFLSPRHNHRTDRWGGTLENRMRFLVEVYHAIRKQVGANFSVGLKLNSADFMKGGFSEGESMQVVEIMASKGIDLIEISGGGYEKVVFIEGRPIKESTKLREAYFLDYAEKIRKRTDLPLVVTGGFRSSGAMIEAIESGATDFVGMGRPLVVDPDLPRKLIERKGYAISINPRSTGIKKLDRMTVIDVLWYQQQMKRMSDKLEPDENMSEWKAIWNSFTSMGRYAFRRVRA